MGVKEMMHDWRNIRIGTWFTCDEERMSAEGQWVRVVYCITKIYNGHVEYHATHDHTKTFTRSLGWVIDNGHELF